MKDILKQIQEEMTTSNFETAEALETAEHYDSLDAEDFEQMEDAEYAEYLDFLDSIEDAEHRKRKRLKIFNGPKKRLHRKHVAKHGKKKAHVKPLKGRAKLAAIGGGGSYAGNTPTSTAAPTFGSASFINKTMTDSVGDLNITITRQTSKIPFALPYILFDLNGYSSNYISTIRQYLPAGVTMVASADPATGDVLLTYTDGGGNTDIVRISLTGSQISYSEFLQSMNQNFFKTHYVRQEYQNDAQLLLAVSQTIRFGLLSSLGMKNANNLLPRSRRLNSDYQTNIINLFLPTQQITADFSFVQNIIQGIGETPVIYAWDIFMSERTNMNNAAFNH